MQHTLTLIIPAVGALAVSANTGASAQSLIKPGDHVALVGNSFADMMRKHGYFETLLRGRRAEISLRNLGWAGDTLTIRQRPTNFPTEDQTLATHKTDVILVCFGMGESFDGEAGLAAFKGALGKLIAHYQSQKYNGESPPRLALVSPIAYEDLGDLTPQPERRNADLAAYTAAMKEVAAAAKIPFVDLFAATGKLVAEKGAPNLTTNGVRLNPYGYWIAGHLLADALAPQDASWDIRLDTTSRKGAAPEGFRVHEVTPAAGGLSFKLEENAWAPPAPPTPATTPATIHTELPFRRNTLIVQNLAPGRYMLNVDGEPLATASHGEWAKGVAIETSPAHRGTDVYRAAVNDKNEQFFHSWRALNQVHIVGERKKSPSGRALPAEVVEFNQLAEERERSLDYLDPPTTTRSWKLVRKPDQK